MLLKTLELENFRQYEGIQSVQFSTDPDKNVTLFLGKNTSGKTTLIQAFRWIFYNDCNFTGKRSDQKNVINNEVKMNMRKGDRRTVSATLAFTHQTISYEVVRKYEYVSRISGDASFDRESLTLYYYDDNGERLAVKGGDSKLKEILPESLAEYFFFDGEKIATSRNPANVKNSINMIMGLIPLEHMINHLISGRINAERTLREFMKDNSGIEAINREIDRIQTKLNQATENYNEAETRYNEMDDKVTSKAMEMATIEAVAKDAEELKTLDDEIKNAHYRISIAELDLIKEFAPAMTELMSNFISIDISENLKNLEYDDKGIPDMTAVSINHILNRGKCICGTDLNNNESCRHEIKELLLYLPPESIGAQIRHLNNNMNGLQHNDGHQKAYNTLKSNYYLQIENCENFEERQKLLSDRIGDNKDADVLKNEYEQYKQYREQFNNNKQKYLNSQEQYKNELEDQKHKLLKAGQTNEYNKDILTKIDYVRELAKKAKEQYDSSSDEVLNVVRSTLIEVFNSMYHGHRTIELSDDYKVTLNVGGERLDNSKGLDTVQNFAFISTLLKVAKDRAENELNSEAYPLAMDAVFSNTDEEHIKNICRELPKLAEQGILAIMDKDWAIASQSLDSYVGKKYRIEKISETKSRIVELK